MSVLIGAGHKARHGKDSIAKYLRDKYGFILIKFADALYEEVADCSMTWQHPNDYIVVNHNFTNYIIKDKKLEEWFFGKAEKLTKGTFLNPTGDKDIRYWFNREDWRVKLELKDSVLLQWWGTDFRRKEDDNYWVEALYNKIMNLVTVCHGEDFNPPKDGDEVTCWCEMPNIVISDVRFNNEAELIKAFNAHFDTAEVWNIVRTDNGIPFVDPTRDPNHPSECDLNDYDFDRVIEAETGHLEHLYTSADIIMEELGVERIE